MSTNIALSHQNPTAVGYTSKQPSQLGHSASGKILRTDQDTKRDEQNRQLLKLAQAEIEELRDSLKYAEYLLAKSKDEKEMLEKQVNENDKLVEKAQKEIMDRDNKNRQLYSEMESLGRQKEFAEMTKKGLQEQTKERLFQLSVEISKREDEVTRLSQQIRDKDSHMAKVSTSEIINRNDNKAKDELLAKKDRQINDLRKELEDTRKRLDEVVMGRMSEGTALLEIEHFKADNERLIQMLSQTKEFQNFGQLAMDSITDGMSGGVRYLNPDRQPEKCHPKKKSTLNEFKHEQEDWIPQEAFKVAHDFRNKCASNIQQSLLNQLLQDLNAIWKNREKKSIQRVQNQSHKELQYLRRQLSFRKPYDQHMKEQDIKRLKKDVKIAQAALRENVAVIQENTQGPLQSLVLVDQTVKYTNQIQQERRQLLDENEYLKIKVEELEKQKREDTWEKEKFYEGAAWMAKLILENNESLITKIDDLGLQYKKKYLECGRDEFLKERASEWLVESCVRMAREYRDTNQELLEKALRNKSANQKLGIFK